MTRKCILKTTLVTGLFLVSFGGWFLHHAIHPLSRGHVFLIPILVGLVSVLIIPALFLFRTTLNLAYILNGLAVILGSITMIQFSRHMFPDVAILWCKFALGYALYRVMTMKTDEDVVPAGRFIRYPNMGWWWVHRAGMSLVYAMGNLLWK